MIQVFEVSVFARLLICDVKGQPPANYLNDLWIFDTQEYKWRQIEMKENDRKPSSVLDFCIPDRRSL